LIYTIINSVRGRYGFDLILHAGLQAEDDSRPL